MTSELPQDAETAHVRWWIVGPVSDAPDRQTRTLTRDNFNDTFAALAGSIDVDIGSVLGSAESLTASFAPKKLRDFSLRELVSAVPALAELGQLAEAFGGPAAKRPDPDAAMAHVRTLLGEGDLWRELCACFAPATPTPSATASSSGDTSVDALLDAGAVAPRSEAKSAVDSFISTLRQGSGSASVSATASKAHRNARDVLERRIYAAARTVLTSARSSTLEGLWRGLRLVVDESRPGSISVRLVDVEPDDLIAALGRIPSELGDPMEGPDAVFVLGEIDDVSKLAALAEAGADLDAPIVCQGSATLLGCDDFGKLAALADDDGLDAAQPDAWKHLREQESARWLSVVGNRVVVAAEGTGPSRRHATTSPVLAFASMLSASFCYTGGFARILGKTGGLKAPGMHDVAMGSSSTSIPTEAFVPVRTQTRLAAAGIIALGSARNSDTVLTSAMPTLRASADAFPLAAQVLTGRLVRFARWVLSQLPTGCSGAELSQLFSDAATVFLFPGMPENAAKLEAEAVDEGNAVRLIATVRPELAGIPFEVGFDLPLPFPVSA